MPQLMPLFMRNLASCLLLVLISAVPSPGASRTSWQDLARQPDDWFRSSEGRRVTDNILSWQSGEGTWPKNQDNTAKPFTGDRQKIQGTFDNGSTTEELRFLARAYTSTKEDRCRDAFLKGFRHILRAQYPTGGWPQFFPPGKKYHRHITFNDDAMARLLNFLREVAAAAPYGFLESTERKSAQDSFDRGIQCILKCQIKVQGKLTAWCAQHDELDYSPRPARTYELVSLSGSESAGILLLLMSLDSPSPEVRQAIKAGADWFAASKLTGIRVVKTDGDRRVVKDPAAPPLWARFYEIESNRPFFCGRDGVKKYDLAEIEKERRNGYSWYGNWGERVQLGYAKWKEKWER